MNKPGKAVFLSYASQDAEAARRICEALRAAGVEVWFDQSELVGGDSWDQKIRRQIKECALFVPVISINTQARPEGYFRLEWKLAVDRSHLLADDHPFLLPVVIDATADAAARVPEKFREVQWTRLNVRDTPESLAARVARLLGDEVEPVSDRRTASAAKRNAGQRPALLRKGRGWLAATLTGSALVAVLAIGGWWFRNRTAPADTAPPAAMPERAPTEAQLLIAKISAIVEKNADASRDEWALAETMGARAVALEPGNAEAWAAYADAALGAFHFYFDRAKSPLNDALQRAHQAVTLAPDSNEAKLVLARCYAQAPSDRAEAEQMLRSLLRQHPEDRRVLRALASLLSLKIIRADPAATPDQFAEVFALYDRAAALPGSDPVALREKAALLAGLGLASEADAALERSLALRPGPAAQVLKIWSTLMNQDDLATAAALVDALPGSYYSREDVCEVAAKTWLWKREPEKCLSVVNRFHEDFLGFTPTGYIAGQAYMLLHRPEAARLAWRSALDAMTRDLPASATDIHLRGFLYWKARLLACLGETIAARDAAQVWDQMRGNGTVLMHVALLVELGDIDQALRELPEGLNSATTLGLMLSRIFRPGPAELRHDPAWDPLRGQLRFEELLAKSKPRPDDGSFAMPPDKSAPADKSVAVLAFANLSDDKANEYFADGISEELLNALGKVAGLKVTARTSAFSFKGRDVPVPEIARQLGVAYVVEGSVRKQGDRVRITAQLVKAADGFQVWSDQFDRELKDIFAVQDEIAAVIARNLSLKMGVTAPAAVTVNPAVFQLYAEARQLWNVRSEASLSRMEQLLSRALELDPHFAPAEAGLAQVWVTRAFVSAAAARDEAAELANAVAHATKAIALDPTSAEAFEALGTAALVRGDLAGAETAITRAVTLNPNYATGWNRWGWLLARHGRVDEAVEKCARGREIDPLAWPMVDNYGLALMQAGRHAEAIAALAPIRTMPDSAPVSWANGAVALMLGGRNDEALAVARVVARGGVNGTWSQGLRDWSDGLAAWVLAEAGARDEARVVAERLLAGPPAHRFAAGFSLVALGREDEGCAALAGMPQQLVSYLWLLYQRHEQLADDPRFQRLLGQLNATADFRVARETLTRLRSGRATTK